MRAEHYDVIIIGAGLAGLSLARHLTLATSKRVLLLDRRPDVPGSRQKVGESSVQLAGYYFSKVLDLEELLLRDHLMKYNLRFYWKTPGRENDRFEDYGQAYIRAFSNIASYQLDRNTFEAALLERCCAAPTVEFVAPIADLDIRLAEQAPHEVRFRAEGKDRLVRAGWVVDTTGRNRVLARNGSLREKNAIDHGASFAWVDGLVNIEKLTDSSPREIRLNRDRRATGHLPSWMATNHFMGEGFWFWVIPLQGKTSLGLVYDNQRIARQEVSSAEKLIDWACREFPLFRHGLPQRRVLDYGGFRSFSYGCAQTISASGWAMSGESGRFTDPLYSPGSDFIAVHNTLIVDAICTENPALLARKCQLYEVLMQALYDSLLPTFSTSYDALGDHECFVLKYTWELSVYFAFFVFPFINDLTSDETFIPAYLTRFSRLGEMNRQLHELFEAYYRWKCDSATNPADPVFHELTKLATLRRAEETFYEVGVSREAAKRVLDTQLDNLEELARYMVAHVYSVVLGDPGVLTNASFVASIDLRSLCLDPDEMRDHYSAHSNARSVHEWTLDPHALKGFRAESAATPEMVTIGSDLP